MLFLRFCCCVRFSLSVQCQLMGNHLSCACLLGERVKENIHCIFEAKQKVPELNDNYPRHRTETRPRRTESSIIYHLWPELWPSVLQLATASPLYLKICYSFPPQSDWSDQRTSGIEWKKPIFNLQVVCVRISCSSAWNRIESNKKGLRKSTAGQAGGKLWPEKERVKRRKRQRVENLKLPFRCSQSFLVAFLFYFCHLPFPFYFFGGAANKFKYPFDWLLASLEMSCRKLISSWVYCKAIHKGKSFK